jgi:hypothetical protein
MLGNGRKVAVRSIRMKAPTVRADLFSKCEIHRLPHFCPEPWNCEASSVRYFKVVVAKNPFKYFR